jgi:PAS domain S-box-containing protein
MCISKDTPIELCQVFQSFLHGVVVIDAKGSVCHWNRKAEELFRLMADVAIHQKIDRILPDLAPFLMTCLRTGKSYQVPFRLYNKIPLLLQINPIIHRESVAGAVVVFLNLVDMASFSEGTDVFKNMKYWLDAVIDSSYDGLWICDHSGTVIRVNRASERINKLQAENVIGRNMRDLVAEGLFDKSVTMEVLKKKTSITMIQQLKGGKKILVTGNPIFDDKGEIAYVLTNDRDISEMDNLRSQLQETQALTRGYITKLTELEMEGVDFSSVIYRSEAMNRVLQMLLRVSKFNAAVLLLGESGVGKGMIAKLIHKNSERHEGPFIRVDCTGIPETLFESELFGYERGAFTGARTEGKAGLFELADKGTLFLDEIGDLPMSTQTKLLRFLEDHEIIHIGGAKPKVIDTRIIAATNRNIEEMVELKQFRKDLYYRIHVVPLVIPPLRERSEDILPLAIHFLDQYNRSYGRDAVMSPDVIDVLCKLDFPGNVRELKHLIERLVVSVEKRQIDLTDLPKKLIDPISVFSCGAELPGDLSLKEAVSRYEQLLLQGAVNKHGSPQRVAKVLKVDRATVSRKMKRYCITQPGAILHK